MQGVPHISWEMSAREQFSKCARQIDVCAPYAQTSSAPVGFARAPLFLDKSWSGLALGICSRACDSGSPTDRPDQPAPLARRFQQTYAKQPNIGPIIDYLLTIASTVNAAVE